MKRRLFYALWPDAVVRNALAQLQAPLNGRVTRHANLHLTLAFLGPQQDSLLPVLQDLLGQLPATTLTLSIDRVGYFSRHRIAWAGMRQTPSPLMELHAHLEALLAKHGIAFDAQTDFRPHVTLARDAAPPSDMPFEPILWQADQVALVESVSEERGVTYRVLASRQLER